MKKTLAGMTPIGAGRVPRWLVSPERLLEQRRKLRCLPRSLGDDLVVAGGGRGFARVAAFGLVATVLLVGGCSTVDEGDGMPTLGAPEQKPLSDDAAAPSFTSEWASEFTSAYRHSTSDLQRAVLEDETISDQELLALQDDYRACLEARGFSDISFDQFGGYSLLPPDGMSDTAAGEVLQECGEATWGPRELTYSLYFQINRNPSHQDEAAMVTDCLVREGIVDEGYTSEDYRRDAAQATLPFDTSDPVTQACFSDPLSAGAQ